MTATVEPMPSVSKNRRHTYHAFEMGDGRRDSGSSRSLEAVKEEPLEWNVIVQVPRDEDIEGKEFDISALDKEDLSRLKTDDPFLYHSIPTMRRSTYLFGDHEDEDEEAVVTERSSSSSSSSRRSSLSADFRSRRQGAPYKNYPNKTRQRDSIVRRVSRLSTEAHPSLILEEMMLKEFQDMDDGHAYEEMDLGVTAAELDQIIAELDDKTGAQ
jgi:hypothetical protein